VHAFEVKMYILAVFKSLVWCGAEGYVSGLQDSALLALFCGHKTESVKHIFTSNACTCPSLPH